MANTRLLLQIYGLVTFIYQVSEGDPAIRFVSTSKRYFATHGETVHLECEFMAVALSLFDHPVVWYKIQQQDDCQINMMGNLMEPFASLKRHKASFYQQPPRYIFTLSISDVSIEDIANYTCQIDGPQNTVVEAMTHSLIIRAPTDHMFITDENATGTQLDRDGQLLYTEYLHGTMRCVAHGGNPAPNIRLVLNDADITDQFEHSVAFKTTGTRCRRRVEYTVEMSSRVFLPLAVHDGKAVQCIASVHGLIDNVTSMEMTVSFGPIISCKSESAQLYQTDVALQCEVKARPEVTSLYWVIDIKGTTVSQGDVVNEFWTSVMVRSDGLLTTQLFIHQTRLDNFRTYTLVAENAIAVHTKDVVLSRAFSSPSPGIQTPQSSDLYFPNDTYRTKAKPGYIRQKEDGQYRNSALVIELSSYLYLHLMALTISLTFFSQMRRHTF